MMRSALRKSTGFMRVRCALKSRDGLTTRRRMALPLVLALFCAPLHAATFVVNDLGDASDANPGDGVAMTAGGVATLRAAVEEANSAADADTIEFDAGVFASACTIPVASLLSVSQALIIQGPGADLLSISGQDLTGILDVEGTSAIELYDITLEHARVSGYTVGSALAFRGISLNMVRCKILSNQCEPAAGACYLTGSGPASIIDCVFSGNATFGTIGNGNGGNLYIEKGGATELHRCVFIENVSRGSGSAVYISASNPVNIEDCSFVGNSAGAAGTVLCQAVSTVTIKGCTFSENSSSSRAGAVAVYGTATLLNCTMTGNQAVKEGGAIRVAGTVTVTNCTIVGNEANSDSSGGEYGGGISLGSGTLTIGNSIVAGNTDNGTTGQDVCGTVTSLGGNLIGIEDGSTGFTGTSDQVGTTASPMDALLGPLADNGGPTQTCLPLAGSPAVNAGLNELVTNPPFDGPPYYDQRGADYLRILGAAVDIGAVEAEVPPDSTPPVITLLGETAMTWECGTAFSDPGATASDDTDGDISANIAVTGTVDITSPGDYVLTYNVSDAAGNAAEPVTRTVTVQDTTPPIITLTGDAAVTMPCNTDYVELGATGSDACDTSLPDVGIDASAVNTDVAGTYSVTYTLTDAAGNVATPVTRTVTVEGPCAVTYHTADQDQNDLISLTELLRIIQFFNSGGFHCESGTEDGYAPGATGDTSCAIHQSDYMPQDWKISLSELLRIIQFFNSGGYHACPDAVPATEDGYCVGPG